MKVCVLGSLPLSVLQADEVGGFSKAGATWLPQVAKGFESEAGIDFHWLIVSKEVSEYRVVRIWNQTFHLFPRWKHSISILTKYYAECSKMNRVLDEIGPDVIHAWGTEDVYGVVAAKRKEAKILSVQGILQEICKVSMQPFLLRWQSRYEKGVLAKMPLLTVESEWGRARLKHLAPKARIEVIEYGVNPLFFEGDRKPEPNPVCLFVGSLTKSKGVDLLLKAFADPRLSGTELWLVGDGPLRPSAESCPPNVMVLGRLEPTEVRNRMQRAWCLVHPTLVDTSPNCVKEARVVGLPIVTTTAGGQVQYVEHGKSGWIHEPGDAEGLIHGILFVTASMEASLSHGAYDQARCRQALDSQQTVGSLVRLYRNAQDSGQE